MGYPIIFIGSTTCQEEHYTGAIVTGRHLKLLPNTLAFFPAILISSLNSFNGFKK
jgi:hypothetical protein